jgi:hypothetical protein
MPFLMKGKLDATLDTTRYLPTEMGYANPIQQQFSRVNGWKLYKDSKTNAEAVEGGTSPTHAKMVPGWQLVETSGPWPVPTAVTKRTDTVSTVLRLDGISMKNVHILLETRRRRKVHAMRQAAQQQESKQLNHDQKVVSRDHSDK